MCAEGRQTEDNLPLTTGGSAAGCACGCTKQADYLLGLGWGYDSHLRLSSQKVKVEVGRKEN